MSSIHLITRVLDVLSTASDTANLTEKLARHIGIYGSGLASGLLDETYLSSPAFQANIAQALRAAEIAESDDKLGLIARALAGCALAFPPPTPDKVQTLRIVEALSMREFHALAAVFDRLDPIDPYADALPVEGASAPGFSRQEFEAALLGLGQLGLLMRTEQRREPYAWANESAANVPVWRLTALARQVALLIRLQGAEQ
ncbi:hypothetical protein K7W42_03770 [Deinococcus sp. HMF7604]|uniref:hypothetical protein n=1 Tax=Deinococcus betulae TaxID=2873312 RepID=UPI001CCF679A|nr:hypothetical protein [Deinococcus betulae]MBZ9749977.1 hypothetical protein [Deinococcus betulae]